MKKRTIEDLKSICQKHGGELLSLKYEGNKGRYKVLCKEGHEWNAWGSHLFKGHWCLKCSRSKKHTIEELKDKAKKKGGECLSERYMNVETFYTFKCAKGHTFDKNGRDVFRGHWCRTCAYITASKKKFKYDNLNYMKELAKTKGGELISHAYLGSSSNHSFVCKNKHNFDLSLSNLKAGQWCKHCFWESGSSIFEQEIFEFVKSFYNDAILGKMGMLPNKKFQLDIFVPSLRKAIECDGRYWHSRPQAKERDARKNVECKETGIDLLRVDELYYKNNPLVTLDEIKTFLQLPYRFCLYRSLL